MYGILKGSIAIAGALALAGTAFAQQGGGQGQGQGGQRPAGQGAGQGAPGGGPGGGGGGGRPPGPPPFTGKPVFANLKGSSGLGSVTVVVNPPEGTACYLMNVSHFDNVTGATLAQGAEGSEGQTVLTLKAPAEGTSGGCEKITAQVGEAMLANPGNYYVSVASRTDGTIRGQLHGDITRPLPK